MPDIFGSCNSLHKFDTQRGWLRHFGFQRALPLFKGIEASPSRVPTITYFCIGFKVIVCLYSRSAFVLLLLITIV